MSVSREDAATTLQDLARAQARSSELYGYQASTPYWIMWGLLAIAGYALEQRFPMQWFVVWGAVDSIGFSPPVSPRGSAEPRSRGAISPRPPCCFSCATRSAIGRPDSIHATPTSPSGSRPRSASEPALSIAHASGRTVAGGVAHVGDLCGRVAVVRRPVRPHVADTRAGGLGLRPAPPGHRVCAVGHLRGTGPLRRRRVGHRGAHARRLVHDPRACRAVDRRGPLRLPAARGTCG